MGFARTKGPAVKISERTYTQESRDSLYQHFYDKARSLGASESDAEVLAKKATARLQLEDVPG